ncbi:MAG: ribosome assembly cofactor RimP [Bacteroidetes bacterium]|nr:ribosome assembly cofactor RimP [Bacteroidota bacterium]
MITPQYIADLASAKLADSGSYLVDVSVAPGNRIVVTIDNEQGLGIADCVAMSRWIENQLDREAEDFSLDVTSPGLDQPFKVFRQYVKNIGREVEVKQTDGKKLGGILVSAAEGEGIVIEEKKREKVEGKKSKQNVTYRHEVPFASIKETKIVIKF